jgi:pimeloyl-ACP methyl ester carboxylesterase
MAEQLSDVGRGITLCYETFGEESAPPMLLIQGLGMQMIAWPDDFCQALAERGFYVLRVDNRDAGRSTHIKGPPPTPGQLLRRRIRPVLYTLSDMAADAQGLLRELELEPAHVVGISMGGMVAQMVAAEHPASVRSLVSLMSNTGSRWRGQPAFTVYRFLLRPAPIDREGFINHTAQLFSVIGSRGLPRDAELTRQIAARMYDRGVDPAGTGRQLGAIVASGNRSPQLRKIAAPTLVIHGSKDLMVSRSGGVATARVIPGARMTTIEGMGHDLPTAAWPQLLDAISEHAHAADRTPITTT